MEGRGGAQEGALMHTEELRGGITSQVPGTKFGGGLHSAEQPHQQGGPGTMESLPCPGCPRHLADTWCPMTEGADQGLEAPRVWEQDIQTSPGFPGSAGGKWRQEPAAPTLDQGLTKERGLDPPPAPGGPQTPQAPFMANVSSPLLEFSLTSGGAMSDGQSGEAPTASCPGQRAHALRGPREHPVRGLAPLSCRPHVPRSPVDQMLCLPEAGAQDRVG